MYILCFNEIKKWCYEFKKYKYKERMITNSLMKFYNNVKKKPKFMCVIVGYGEAIFQNKENGIYVVPLTSLKPWDEIDVLWVSVKF